MHEAVKAQRLRLFEHHVFALSLKFGRYTPEVQQLVGIPLAHGQIRQQTNIVRALAWVDHILIRPRLEEFISGINPDHLVPNRIQQLSGSQTESAGIVENHPAQSWLGSGQKRGGSSW